jgi:hypothetical protein
VHRIRGGARAGATLLVFVLVVAASACSGDDDDGGGGAGGASGNGNGDEALTVDVLSSRPEYVTGGDALVAVTIADDGIDPDDVSVTLGDTDVTDAFAPDPDDPTRLVGLVEGLDGLDGGEGEVTATAGDDSASVTLVDHPAQGPLFSGPPLPLAACTTQLFGLEASTPDDDCAAPPKLTWQYVDREGALHDLADPARPPDDADTVELESGETVPFVIRNEWGVLNRSVYRITLLDADPAADPAAGDAPDTTAWNGRLVYRFGGGCGTTFTQGYFGTGEPSVEVLRRGYAAASATFNTYQVMCNDMLSAETMAMVKEHFVETYGVPVHTIGEGGSGGAIQQMLIAQNYPGLLDAIVPSVPFPDALSIGGGVFDCALLTRYYAGSSGQGLTPSQRAAINGHGVAGTCDLWNASFATNIDPKASCTFDVAAVFGAAGGFGADIPTVPADQIYDGATNPDGFRCGVWESNEAITGTDPDTGFANSGYDNEGIQYGLDALNDGVITPDQFVDLNARIGGFDIDGQPQADRSVVSDELAGRAYTSGRVTGPYGGLPDTPIILINVYTDMQGDIHDRVRSFSIMDRLADADGNVPDTVSLWTVGADPEGGIAATLTGALGDFAAGPTFVMDEWLTAATDHQAADGGSWQDALSATKPEAAESRCTVDGEEIVGPDANADSRCEEAYPVHEEPRMAAGMPRSGDVLKCSRIDVADAADGGEVYDVSLSDAQLARLADIFPTGVCDYTQPAVGQAEPDDTWQSFL